MGLLDGLKNIITGKGADLVKNIGGIIDDVNLSGEEKATLTNDLQKAVMSHEEKILELTGKETEAYLADMNSAREANVKIQESANSSKLAKNVAYYLDLIITFGFFIMFGMILFKSVPPENRDIFYTGFGLLGGYVASIINFHRGSSAGSAKKQEQMDKMLNER